MQLPKSEILAIVHESTPPAFWAKLLDFLVLANVTSLEALGALGIVDREKRDTFGHLQRGAFETHLRQGIPSAFPSVKADSRDNSAGTSGFTLLSSGRLRMTASARKQSLDLPRGAEFRSSLAQSSQLPLYEPRAAFDPTSMLYGIFTYDYTADYELYFAQFVVPDSKCEAILATVAMDGELAAAIERRRSGAGAASPIPSEEKIAEPKAAPLRKGKGKKKKDGEGA